MRSQAFSSRRFSAILLAALLAGCHAGSSTTTVNKVIVTISPISARLTTGASQQFTATVTGTKKTAVTWSAIYGTVSTTGLYSAPPVGSSVTQDTVIATSVDDIVDAAAAVISITPALGTPSVTPLARGRDRGGVWHAAIQRHGDESFQQRRDLAGERRHRWQPSGRLYQLQRIFRCAGRCSHGFQRHRG
jgi:hypothetical protein